ncbi:MAG: tetratricopeptide repeat protein [Pseudonocardiaceae bacterium]
MAAGSPDLHVLFVQPSADTDLAVAGEVCRTAGMAELPNGSLMSVYMLREAVSRGLATIRRPWTVWVLTAADVEARTRHRTPPTVLEVVQELQERLPGVSTLSTSLTQDQMATMDERIEDVERDRERALRDAVRSGEAGAEDLRQLGSLLDHRGEHREAETRARAAIALDEESAAGWEILGRTLLHQGDVVGVRDALQESLARDPTSVLVLTILATCHERLGDHARAAELLARASSLTGGRESDGDRWCSCMGSKARSSARERVAGYESVAQGCVALGLSGRSAWGGASQD